MKACNYANNRQYAVQSFPGGKQYISSSNYLFIVGQFIWNCRDIAEVLLKLAPKHANFWTLGPGMIVGWMNRA